MKEWLTKLIDQRVEAHHLNNQGRWAAKLSFEDKEAVKRDIAGEYSNRLNRTIEAITEETIKEYVEKVVDEVVTRTEVIEKVVEKVNDVQLKGMK